MEKIGGVIVYVGHRDDVLTPRDRLGPRGLCSYGQAVPGRSCHDDAGPVRGPSRPGPPAGISLDRRGRFRLLYPHFPMVGLEAGRDIGPHRAQGQDIRPAYNPAGHQFFVHLCRLEQRHPGAGAFLGRLAFGVRRPFSPLPLRAHDTLRHIHRARGPCGAGSFRLRHDGLRRLYVHLRELLRRDNRPFAFRVQALFVRQIVLRRQALGPKVAQVRLARNTHCTHSLRRGSYLCRIHHQVRSSNPHDRRL